MASDETTGESYEEEHVHRVYQEIAHHFSSTRYKPWPIVERFLTDLPAGCVGLDVGCGNGKYLPVNPDIFIIASDRSQTLTAIASKCHPHAAIVADNLHLPHRQGLFDFALSIAVVHHLSTPARRVRAIAAVLETLKPPTKQPGPDSPNENTKEFDGGKALIYVWALEQRSSRRGWDKGDKQDVMVPWVKKEQRSDETSGSGEAQTFLRYYHLYEAGELERDIVAADGHVLDHGYEKDNWWAIATRSPTAS